MIKNLEKYDWWEKIEWSGGVLSGEVKIATIFPLGPELCKMLPQSGTE